MRGAEAQDGLPRRGAAVANKNPSPFTPEQRAKGRAVREANAKRRMGMTAEVKAIDRFEQASEKMAQVIINAALGIEGFEKLSVKERAGFALKVLEYGVGRPRQAEAPMPPEAAAAQGLHFGVGSPQGELIGDQPAESPSVVTRSEQDEQLPSVETEGRDDLEQTA